LRVVPVFGIEDFEKTVAAGAPAPVERNHRAEGFRLKFDALFEREGTRHGHARAVEIEQHRVGGGVDDGDVGQRVSCGSIGATAHRINASLFQIAAQHARRVDAPLSRACRRDAHQGKRRDDGDDGEHD
jgi:hypothetical protein